MDLKTLQQNQGAQLAPDHIPLDFGDQAAEYNAALKHSILLDRSHEARLALYGQSALDVIQRISTNDLGDLEPGEGRPTIFVNAHARILDRICVYKRGDHVLILGEPGRGPALAAYLQRNIFFGDDVRIVNLGPETQAFDLHGPQAHMALHALDAGASAADLWQSAEVAFEGASLFVARRKAVVDQRWTLMIANDTAVALWSRLSDAGAVPAGSLIYDVLRVRAGLPSVGRELSDRFIPLELGLWDEVSFSKGCYTGQEIIARMESRHKLAKTMVSLKLDRAVDAPTEIYDAEQTIGQLTSCVTAPDGEIFALGVVKPIYAQAGQNLAVGTGRITAQVIAPAGVQPTLN